MTMSLAPVRLELTTLEFLAPLSDQLSYRALYEEDTKTFSVERMEKTRNKGLYLTWVTDWKIPHLFRKLVLQTKRTNQELN